MSGPKEFTITTIKASKSRQIKFEKWKSTRKAFNLTEKKECKLNNDLAKSLRRPLTKSPNPR